MHIHQANQQHARGQQKCVESIRVLKEDGRFHLKRDSCIRSELPRHMLVLFKQTVLEKEKAKG